jgi:hypothetical protein
MMTLGGLLMKTKRHKIADSKIKASKATFNRFFGAFSMYSSTAGKRNIDWATEGM